LNRNQRLVAGGERLEADARIAVILLDAGGDLNGECRINVLMTNFFGCVSGFVLCHSFLICHSRFVIICS
jgi:hypothetical protein